MLLSKSLDLWEPGECISQALRINIDSYDLLVEVESMTEYLFPPSVSNINLPITVEAPMRFCPMVTRYRRLVKNLIIQFHFYA